MSNTNEDNKDPNHVLRIWTKISDETGISVEMVGHIHRSITDKCKIENCVDSKKATQFIIQDLIDNDKGAVQEILENHGIKSSGDFGTVVKRLCEEEVLFQEENDNYEDFNGLFKTESIEDYLKLHRLKKKSDWFKIISYSLYVLGFAIVVSSYVIPVQNTLGWFGWALGMCGWALLSFKDQIVESGKKIISFIRR